jgi:hypothetical protein
MKYIKKYKLFESVSDYIEYYLNVLETDDEEIKYILIDLIDLGYTTSYDIAFMGADGKLRVNKNSSEVKPRLILKLKAPSNINVQRTKYTNTKLLSSLTNTTNHIISTFDDKCDIYYMFGGGSWDITYVFEFPIEKDDTKLKFNINDLKEILINSFVSDDDYSMELSNSENGFSKISLNLNDRKSKSEELLNIITREKEKDLDYVSNEEESIDIIKKTLMNFIKNLELKYNIKFEFESLKNKRLEDIKTQQYIRNAIIYYYKNGDKIEFINLGYESSFNEYKTSIKSGFFKKRDIWIGLEDKIKVDFKLA